jgi:oxygen-independent coproporphyrinogen-3 oxidase
MYGLYIHIPFCTKICHYCDFFVDKNVGNIDKYVDYLCKEIDLFFMNETNYSQYNKSNLDTIYIGGGTPSLLSPTQLEKITTKIRSYYTLSENLEFSFESNPGSITLENLIEYRNLGVNRISIGVQSFIKRELGFLKRSHSPKGAIKAIENAHKAGFDNINLDMIFSIPEQSLESWKYNLDMTLSLGTNHISAYSLMYEKGTPLYNDWQKGKVTKVSDDDDAKFYLYTIERNAENGFEQYEVSNFAREQKYCKHNLGAWQSGEYFAFGVSSHGNLGNYRFNNFSNLNKYYELLDSNKLPLENNIFHTNLERFTERIFLAIRANGLDLSKLQKDYNLKSEDIKTIFKNPKVKSLIENSYLIYRNNSLSLTGKGYAICDSITFLLTELFEEIFKTMYD